jgi:hypothetical protein
MVKKIIVIAIVAALFVSCKSKSAFNYSEEIVKKERSLGPEMTIVEKNVADFLSAEKYDSVAVAGTRMEKLVQQKIDEIEAMKPPGGKEAEDFKAASIKYFKYIKGIYTNYKSIGNAGSDEERQKKYEELQEMVSDKNAVISNMQSAQKKFADAHGFKVQ